MEGTVLGDTWASRVTKVECVGAPGSSVFSAVLGGGWGWAAFEYDVASASFKPADSTANPPQGNDAKCGFACHQIVKKADYVFTEYAPR